MSKCDEKNRELTGNTPSSRHDQLQPHPVEEERKDRRASQGDSISIISKKVAEKWLSKIIEMSILLQYTLSLVGHFLSES